MSNAQIFFAVIAWLATAGVFGWVTFRLGYNLGWSERNKSMILPRNVTRALNKRIDMEEQHGRHTALDPGKQF